MERVGFIIEDTGERLGCLLNPESVVMRRRAGVEPLRTGGGLVAGTELSDDPVLLTGGGTTELTLDLIFDVSLAGSSVNTNDVRQLTGPLWALAENARQNDGYGRPPLARFVWGKAWNIPGIVSSVAERLAYFTAEGVPRRSWLRLRLIRVAEAASDSGGGRLTPPTVPDPPPPEPSESLIEQATTHEITGGLPLGENGAPISEERLDELAFRYYGDASLWRLLAWLNRVQDPLKMEAGGRIAIPTASSTSIA